ncbi:464_t:CDS:2, partial [Entrophospora sp. SA101]
GEMVDIMIKYESVYGQKEFIIVFNMEDRIQCNNDNADVFDDSCGNTLTPDSSPRNNFRLFI